MAARIAMIAITTSNSIKVNPRKLRQSGFRPQRIVIRKNLMAHE
jgi:hypothetical protein